MVEEYCRSHYIERRATCRVVDEVGFRRGFCFYPIDSSSGRTGVSRWYDSAFWHRIAAPAIGPLVVLTGWSLHRVFSPYVTDVKVLITRASYEGLTALPALFRPLGHWQNSKHVGETKHVSHSSDSASNTVKSCRSSVKFSSCWETHALISRRCESASGAVSSLVISRDWKQTGIGRHYRPR